MTGNKSKLNTTILLLVSDQLVRSVLAEVLEREGYMVVSAGDLGSAVEWLKQSTPDLLIIRTYISDMQGHDAAKYLQTKCHPMRVLIVGGLLADKRLEHREEIAGFEVFPKPYNAAQLIEKVKSVLATPNGETHHF